MIVVCAGLLRYVLVFFIVLDLSCVFSYAVVFFGFRLGCNLLCGSVSFSCVAWLVLLFSVFVSRVLHNFVSSVDYQLVCEVFFCLVFCFFIGVCFACVCVMFHFVCLCCSVVWCFCVVLLNLVVCGLNFGVPGAFYLLFFFFVLFYHFCQIFFNSMLFVYLALILFLIFVVACVV